MMGVVSAERRYRHMLIFVKVILARADGRITVTREEYEAIPKNMKLHVNNEGRAGRLTMELVDE